MAEASVNTGHEPQSRGGEDRPLSRRRKWLFRLLALCIPLVLLAAAETICRLVGYGGYPGVLRVLGSFEGETLVGTDQRGVSTFFFQNITEPGTMEEQVFTSPKPENTVRIFALGGSAMRGYPQPRSLAATSFLQAMLSDLRPDRRFEVINMGTTALASFPLMYYLDEALAYEPDLVIVYSGNNEFYGAHGVASVHSLGGTTWAMKLFRLARRTALIQWITNSLTDTDAAGADEGAPLMERVIAVRQIAPDDGRRGAAASNLENHLTYLVARCREEGVPIIVCTLPANERDLFPIGEDVKPPLEPQALERFNNLPAGAEARCGDHPEEALRDLEAAAELHDDHARLHFLKGRCLAALNRHDEAAAEYATAKDLDTMPWRAPSGLNDVVRKVAGDGAILCDLDRHFAEHSPTGSTGWELMDDHVHPSLRGQAEIARAWLKAMSGLEGPLRVKEEAIEELPGWQEYARRLGANEFDAYAVAFRMRNLFRASFYRDTNQPGLERYEAICAAQESEMSPAELDAVRYWQDPRTHQGGHRPITGVVGTALLAEGRFEEADRLLSIARRNVAPHGLWFLEFSWNALVCRKQLREAPLPEDRAIAQELIESGEAVYAITGIDHPMLHRHLGLAYNMIGEHEQAIFHLGKVLPHVTGRDGLAVIQALANSLVATGQLDRARRLLASPVQDPVLREACRSMLRSLEEAKP